ncbi:MAG: hypothetical protein M3O70_08230 [Actinomycetota bacterium]|nr:hypothetical protein [Actinomycetota bacterium]
MPKATAAERERRRREVARLRKQGATIAELAEKYGVARSSIIRDLQHIESQPKAGQPRTLLALVAGLTEEQRRALGRALLEGSWRQVDAPSSRGAL